MIKDKKTIADSSAGVRTSPLLCAVYCILGSDKLLIAIPKKRGVGYLKSAMGYHSRNDAHAKFDHIKPKWFVKNVDDVDGYLSIQLALHKWDKDFSDGLNDTLSAIKKTFPHIDDFIGDTKTFWKVVSA